MLTSRGNGMCGNMCSAMTSKGHPYAQFQRALKTGNANIALDAAARLSKIELADALTLCLLIREGDPLRYDRAAVRWVALLLGKDRTLCLGDLRELTDLLTGLGRHDRVAQLRLERWLRARGFAREADRVA